MGRRPTVNLNLPKGMRKRKQRSGKTYYYLETGTDNRKEISLGDDYYEALKKYADAKSTSTDSVAALTLKDVLTAYFKSMKYMDLAERTRDDYKACEPKILEFFNDPPAPVETIEASHIQEFMEWRGAESKRRANYEHSVISIAWNYARRKGLTNKPNPCEGVPKFVIKSRDVYVDDDVYLAVYEMACDPVRDAMDLAYLSGQRPADVFKMDETDIRDGCLKIVQNKTNAKLRLKIEADLKVVIDRILARKKKNAVYSLALICDEKGRRLSQDAIAQRFRKIRTRVITKYPKMAPLLRNFQFRDLRAKSATDIFDREDIKHAQNLLGHTDASTTEVYVRTVLGQEVSPTLPSTKIRSAILSRAS